MVRKVTHKTVGKHNVNAAVRKIGFFNGRFPVYLIWPLMTLLFIIAVESVRILVPCTDGIFIGGCYLVKTGIYAIITASLLLYGMTILALNMLLPEWKIADSLRAVYYILIGVFISILTYYSLINTRIPIIGYFVSLVFRFYLTLSR